jgi:hypothetical protein
MKFLPSIPGFLNPITRFLEDQNLIQRRLVGQFEAMHDVDYDRIDDDALFGDVERVMFFLFEYPSGRRTFEVLDYGQAEEMEVYRWYLPDVMAWVHGGELPKLPEVEPVPEAPKVTVAPFTVLLGGVKS